MIKEHIKLHAEIKGTEREEKWEYPIEAIIESLTQIQQGESSHGFPRRVLCSSSVLQLGLRLCEYIYFIRGIVNR